jgi:large subunit ribosomal protein L17
MQRNLAQSLFEHGQVRTTLQKAKDLRPFAERLITLAIKSRAGSITARRRIHHLLSDRSIVPAEHQEAYDVMSNAKRDKTLRNSSGRRYRSGAPKGKLAFTGETVTYRLINTIAPKFEDRPGGYTRLIRLAERRVGDHGELAIVQLVGDEEGPGAVSKPAITSRRRRADARYSAAIKATKARSGGKKSAVAEAPEPASEDKAEPAGESESTES